MIHSQRGRTIGRAIILALLTTATTVTAFAQEETAEAAEGGASAAGLSGLFLLAGVGFLVLTGFILWSQNRANGTN